MPAKFFAHILIIFALVALTACTAKKASIDTDRVPGSFHQNSKIIQGIGIGAASGAAFGQITDLGVPAGAIVGGIIGGVIGSHETTRILQAHHVQWVRVGDENTIILPTDKFFIPGGPTLYTDSYPALNIIVADIKRYNSPTLTVTGFTDNMGTQCYSCWLAKVRAQAIASYLWVHDIPVCEIKVKSYGQDEPIASFRTLTGKTLDRHVEISFRAYKFFGE